MGVLRQRLWASRFTKSQPRAKRLIPDLCASVFLGKRMFCLLLSLAAGRGHGVSPTVGCQRTHVVCGGFWGAQMLFFSRGGLCHRATHDPAAPTPDGFPDASCPRRRQLLFFAFFPSSPSAS